MFELNPAESVKTAIQNSKRYAVSMGSTCVATEHLLLGLCSVEKSMANKILQKYDVNLKKLERLVKDKYPDTKPLPKNISIDSISSPF